MGTAFYDGYSVLHIAVGVVAWHWGIGFLSWVLMHALFEFLENTATGMHFINTYVTAWPGGKPLADSLLNRTGDTVFAAFGWWIAAISMR